MIALFDVTIPHRSEEGTELRKISLEMDRGGWHEIVGPSGVGKSALFEVLTLRRRPPGGKLVIAGRNVDRLTGSDLAEVRRDLGSCSQRPVLLWRRSVIENVMLPMVVRGMADEAVDTAEDVLGFLGMFDEREQRVGRLDDQRRRLVAVARATVGTPPMVVIDGVHEQLEPAVRGMVLSWLEDVSDRGSTVVMLGRRAVHRGAEAVVWRLGKEGIEQTGEVSRC